RTHGNPFFVEEFVRALSPESDAGAATAVAASRPIPLALPTVVRSLIEERVTRLGADLHDLLDHATILGQEFSVRSLRAMSGLADETLSDLLERAFTAGILTDRSSVVEERYGFAHDYIQEAIYDSIGRPRRRRLHQRAGEAIEALGAGVGG